MLGCGAVRCGRVWHKASVSDCWPLAVPIGLSPPLILTLCGPERVWVVSTEPPDNLSCLTTPGIGRPGDGAVACAVDQGHPDAQPKAMWGFADSTTDLCAPGGGGGGGQGSIRRGGGGGWGGLRGGGGLAGTPLLLGCPAKKWEKSFFFCRRWHWHPKKRKSVGHHHQQKYASSKV